MIKFAHNEKIVYGLVLAGELSIDNNGDIWRLRERRGCGKLWFIGCKAKECLPKRAEFNKGNYLRIHATMNNRRFNIQAHRLVWYHFYGPIPKNMTINHKNGDGKDNRPENLELLTVAENLSHARKILGTLNAKGEKNGRAKLTESDVRQIRAWGYGKYRNKDLAKIFKVKKTTISDIIHRRNWAWLK